MVKYGKIRIPYRLFYMVVTYGSRHGGAAELTERFCRSCGILPNYINDLLMVDNWLPGFDMDEQKVKDIHLANNQIWKIL